MTRLVQDGLYHASLGNVPWSLLNHYVGGSFALEYGSHARTAALNDRFGRLTSAPLAVMLVHEDIFEVEIEQGQVSKFCVRLSSGFGAASLKSGGLLDLVLVCVPSIRVSHGLFVKTLWFNERSDSHTTLDATKYVQP